MFEPNPDRIWLKQEIEELRRKIERSARVVSPQQMLGQEIGRIALKCALLEKKLSARDRPEVKDVRAILDHLTRTLTHVRDLSSTVQPDRAVGNIRRDR